MFIHASILKKPLIMANLSDALLKRYQLTEKDFRQKFRSSKQEIGETAG